MKRLIMSIAALLFFLQLAAQNTEPVKDKQYYATKSKNRKIVGFVLLGAGVTCMTTGIVVAKNTNDFSGYEGLGEFMAGVPLSLASIPFFISAARNRGRAEAMAGPGIQPIHLGPSLTKLAPGITIKIQF